ncbi:hypothetical protein Q5762_00440 [Streptomyces sp. P9(2023)]|uniref:hypothetical protein n=1 Tax=Streptomyces sp. P9(2023) TaxID=3064394 RepID=UPI0028F456D6|nr:hypothetical protein [Streptomyces sp. P9(2023)]MDT9686843.1 hypothetical protein [Streptomyces sp. P9(2023)]
MSVTSLKSADSVEKSPAALAEFVGRTVTQHAIPGVTVGMWADGRETPSSWARRARPSPPPRLMRLVADGRVERTRRSAGT